MTKTNDAVRPHGSAPAVTPALAAVRQQIDCLDATLVEILARRQALAAEVAAAKPAEDGRLRLRPARERQVLQRLADLKVAPAALVEGVWSELMGFSLQLQQPTRIVVHAPRYPIQVTDAARRRFGRAAPLDAADSAEAALAAALGANAIAVIEHDPLSGWWTALPGQPGLLIFDVLRGEDGDVSALVAGRVGPEDVVGPAFEVTSEEAAARRSLRRLAVCGGLALCLPDG